MIRSTVEIIYNDAFQCGKCMKRVAETYRERVKGCSGKKEVKREADGYFYTRCPGNFYNPGYAQLLDVHRLYRKGILAHPGGVMDQPSKYLDAMNLIENMISEKEIEQMKKQARKGKNGRK